MEHSNFRSLIQLQAVMLKEIRQTVRDRRMVGMLLIAPFIQLIVFGFAVNFDVDRVPTVVVDRDDTPASRLHLRRLLADGTLLRSGSAASEAEGERMLETGEAAALVVVPEGFDRDLTRGRTAQIQVVLDGSDSTRGNVAGAAVGRYFGEVGVDLARAQLARREAMMGRATHVPGVTLEPRILYNPQLRSAVYMVPGVAAMLLVIVTTIITAMGLAREREMGTLEQVLVTPIPPGVLMVGKLIPFAVIGMVDVLAAMVVGMYIFRMPMRGDVSVLFLATALYLLSTLGMGLLITTFSRTQQQAYMGAFMFMLPAILLSGNITPISSMPEWLQPLTWLNPVRYYIEVMRANLLRGAGFADLWVQLSALLIFGVSLITVAAASFRKQTS